MVPNKYRLRFYAVFEVAPIKQELHAPTLQGRWRMKEGKAGALLGVCVEICITYHKCVCVCVCIMKKVAVSRSFNLSCTFALRVQAWITGGISQRRA